MFDTPVDAIEFLDDFLDPPAIEIVLKSLNPVIGFKPAKHDKIGGTRIGGTPDLPPGIAWPQPPKPDDSEKIASRGNEDATQEMREHLSKNLPYAFVAQIDLGEAAGLGSVSASLPQTGRLLFFYDFVVGPWETSSRVGHVIWDRSTVENLKNAALPDDLSPAHGQAAKELAMIVEEFDGAEDAELGTNYNLPSRPMQLSAKLASLDSSSIEFEKDPLSKILAKDRQADGKFAEAYTELDYLFRYPDNESWQAHRLLGSPAPEQNDPRFDAVAVSKTGDMLMTSEQYKTLEPLLNKEAPKWRLLLQIGISDATQFKFSEGTIYFLIHRDDLEKDNFNRVITVYQQT